MDVFDHKELKLQAKHILADQGAQIRKITWIYCAIVAAISFLTDLISFLLSNGAVTNAQQPKTLILLFSLASSLFLYLWNAGYVYISVALLRNQTVSIRDLHVGFRLFWPVFRVTLLVDLIIFGISLAVSFVAMLFTLSTILSLGVFLAGLGYILYMSYRLGFALYVALEAPQLGTKAAISYSRRFTEENCRNLFRLDLSFWWYFALLILVALVGSLPLLLELWEVNIGLSPLVSFFLSSTLCALGSFLLNVKCFPYLALSRAGAFLFLRDDYLSQEQLWY